MCYHTFEVIYDFMQHSHQRWSNALAQVVDEYSRKSFRLMALAVGKLPHVHQLDLTCMSQQQVEARAEGFQLLGLIVVANQVRQDSKNAVIQLQHRQVLFVEVLLAICKEIFLKLYCS